MNILDLFRGRALRGKTLLITFCWIANALVYVAIPYNLENLGGNLFLTYVSQASMEIPATLLNLFTLNRFGRIWPLFCAMMLSGASCLLTAPGDNWPVALIIILAVLAKFGISSGYDVIYQLAGELYPTVVRGTGIGFCSIVGETFNIIMPYIVHLAQTYRMLPMIIFGIFAVVGGFCTLFLPETLNQAMPETLVDGESHGKVGFGSFRTNVGWCCAKRTVAYHLPRAETACTTCTELQYDNEQNGNCLIVSEKDI